MPNGWRTIIKSLVHKIRLHDRRGKGMAESFSREKLRHAPQKEGGWEILCDLPPVYVCIYVCMVITYSRVWINRVRLPILLVVSWTGEMNIPLSPCVPENLVSRDGFSRPVPRQPAHLHIQAESGAYLRDSSRVPRRRPLWNRHTPSGQSRVYRVTQLRTEGVHCRESAGTGPVNLKVVPNGCCLGRSPWTNVWPRLVRPTNLMSRMNGKKTQNTEKTHTLYGTYLPVALV